MSLNDDVAAGLAALAAEMPRCDAERHGAELYGAPRFSVFSLFGDKETTLSRVLADLFDPNGSHGQGALVLNELLRVLQRPSLARSDERTVSVQTEAPVRVVDRATVRRIDILIKTKTDLIGIENKKWTGQSEDQLKDYWNHINSQAQAKAKKPHLLFISNDQPNVREAIRLPYLAGADQPSIDRLLATAEPQIRALRIKDFIADFRAWISRVFGGSVSMTATQPYQEAVDAAISGPNGAKAIGAVLASADTLRSRVVDDIEKYLRRELSAVFPDIRFGSKHGASRLIAAVSRKHVGWHAWRDAWPKNCVLCIEAERGDLQGIGYGVVALDPSTAEGRKYAGRVSEKIELLNKAVTVVPGGGEPSDWWRWDRAPHVRNWTIPALADELLKGATKPSMFFGADKMAEDLVALAKAVDTV